ncbi:MAG: DUF4124 domain-containing protein [Gammaproteobacteria bacterium]|jgi:hypothetical protein|nr:DUF4124 domain-containing protein [Gammaproteobacteria bacterium]
MIKNRKEYTSLCLTSFLFIVFSSTSAVHAAKMYKWVDEEGNVTYSQKPPPTDSGIQQENIKVSGKAVKPHKRGKKMYCGKSALPTISKRPEQAISMLEENLLNWRDKKSSTKERRDEYARKNSKNFNKLSFAEQLKTYNIKVKETDCKIDWAKSELENLEEERTKIVKNHDNIGNALQELEQKKILSCGSNRYSGVVVLDDEAREYFKCEKRFDREISKMKKKLRNSENNVKMIDY